MTRRTQVMRRRFGTAFAWFFGIGFIAAALVAAGFILGCFWYAHTH